MKNKNNMSPRRLERNKNKKKTLISKSPTILENTKTYTRLNNKNNNFKKIKINKNKKSKQELITTFIVLLVLLIISYSFLDKILTLLLIVGLTIIITISNLTEKLKRKKSLKIFINIFSTLLVFFIIALISSGCYLLLKVIKSSPEFNKKLLKKNESTLIYDSQNKLIAEVGEEKRDNKKFDEMSEVLIDSVIATEDARFFQHNGVDPMRFLKATASLVLHHSDDGGGASTISMQVIKNTYTDTSKEKRSGLDRYLRKFQDIYLAVFELEKNFTKREILEFYLNNQQIGPNAFGVEQSSHVFFNKKAAELNLAEASLMAGLFQAPATYNPITNPKNAARRRNTVLYLLKRHGYISEQERDIASRIPIDSLLSRGEDRYRFQGYIDGVLKELKAKGYNPYKESLMVYTALDSDRQTKIENILNGNGGVTWPNDKIQSGVAVVDVHSGKVLAIGPGRNRSGKRDYNFAIQGKKQIGSSAKPLFDYGPGMEFNNFSTYTIFTDEPHSYTNGPSIRNHDGAYMGTMTLRQALALSRNIPALKAFQQINNKKIIEFVKGLGITPEETNGTIHEAHALGAFNGSNPLEMAAAYAAFANGGTYYKPYFVTKIVNRETGEKKTFEPDGKKAMSDSTAFMITDVLKTTMISGSGRPHNPNNGAILAGKTGTTNHSPETFSKYHLPYDAIGDIWLITYDPDVSMGFFVGYDNLKYGSNRNRDYPMFYQLGRAYNNAVFKTRGIDFKVPDSVVKVPVEYPTNPPKLASSGTPSGNIRYEWFKKGTEPTETSIAYNPLSNVTNLTIRKEGKDIILNWNGAKEPANSDQSYGKFGYKIYHNNNFIAFTQNNSHKIINVENPAGTYKVVTCYELFSGNASSGATVSIASSYRVKLNAQNIETYQIGHTITQPKSSDITVTDNDVTINPTIAIKIVNSANNAQVDRVPNDVKGKYFVTYNISYNGETIENNIKRTIIVSD